MAPFCYLAMVAGEKNLGDSFPFKKFRTGVVGMLEEGGKQGIGFRV